LASWRSSDVPDRKVVKEFSSKFGSLFEQAFAEFDKEHEEFVQKLNDQIKNNEISTEQALQTIPSELSAIVFHKSASLIFKAISEYHDWLDQTYILKKKKQS
jgi:hypothetical protein